MTATARGDGPAAPLAGPREKFATARRELSDALIEREEEVDLALTALLAGEHMLVARPAAASRCC